MLATTRPITSSETTMEDTHVWVMKADGSARRELGAVIDNRQGPPRWSADGAWVYFTVRGTRRRAPLPPALSGRHAGRRRPAAGEPGTVGAWSLAKDGTVAFAMTTPGAPANCTCVNPARLRRRLTDLNRELLASGAVAPVERLQFKGPDGLDVEAFLTTPPDQRGRERRIR